MPKPRHRGGIGFLALHLTFMHPPGNRKRKEHTSRSVAFYRIKRVGGRDYVFEVETIRIRRGVYRQRVIRYVGPVEPVYGGRGPVDVAELRKVRTRGAIGAALERASRNSEEP